MKSFYAIVQYGPDPVRNEQVNIGVLAYGDGRVRSLFLRNWRRVRQFADKDVSFLKDIAHDAQHWDEAAVKRLASQWTGTVQITEPSASILPPDELLVDAGFRYLVEPASAKRGYRGKADAVRIIRHRVREKLMEKMGPVGRKLLRERDYLLPGKHMAYQCDLSVGNGRPIFAAQGLSFELPETRHLAKEISATAWLIEDVRAASPDFPIGVMAIRPRPSDGEALEETYGRAVRTFTELGATVFEEDGMQWVDRMVGMVPMPGPY